MLSRYRWYRIKVPKSIGKLSDLIENFSSENEGIRFTKVADKSYRFYIRTVILVTRMDQAGIPVRENIESFGVTDFSIVDKKRKLFLRIENPGRNVKQLLDAVELAVGMGFTSKLITFGTAQPTTVFDKVEFSRLIGIRVSQATVGDGIISNMEFVAKHGIDIADITALKGVQYTVNYLVYRLGYKGLSGHITINTNGNIKIGGKLAPLIVSLIEDDLPSLD